jgi:hypothetical protein
MSVVQGEVAVISNEKEKEQLKTYIKELLPSSVKFDTVALEITATKALEREDYQSLSDTKLLKLYEYYLNETKLNETKPNLTLSEKIAKRVSSVGSSFTDAASSAASSFKSGLTSTANAVGFIGRNALRVGGKSRRRAKKSSRAKKANRRTRHK